MIYIDNRSSTSHGIHDAVSFGYWCALHDFEGLNPRNHLDAL